MEIDLRKPRSFSEGLHEDINLNFVKVEITQLQGIAGEAVVLYSEAAIAPEMRHPRLSLRVNNTTIDVAFLDFTGGDIEKSP